MSPVEIADTKDWNRSPAGSSHQCAGLTKVDVDDPTWRFDSDFELQMDSLDETSRLKSSATAVIGSVVEIETAQTTERFRLQKFLGSGGMGSVFAAAPLSSSRTATGSFAAVKILKCGSVATDAHMRFENERSILSNLSHENVVRFIGRGTDSQKRPLIAMEFLDGTTLTEYCKSSKISSRDRLRLFLEVCSAVQHCHKNNVIHRDLKPANILTHFDGEKIRAKLIDFGVAITPESNKMGDETSDNTRSGEASSNSSQPTTSQPTTSPNESLVGTLQYMSPEQAGPNGNPVDQRSDIYSLGVILYELLAGEPPVSKRAVMQKTISEIIDQVRFSDQRPVSQIASDVEDLRGDYGQAIDLIVEKCLEKDRADRFDHVGQLIHSVNLALTNPRAVIGELKSPRNSLTTLNGHSKSLTPATKPKRLTQRLKRVTEQHFWKAISACLLVTLLISGLGRRSNDANANTASKIQLPADGHAEEIIIDSFNEICRSATDDQNFEIQLIKSGDPTCETPSLENVVQLVVVEKKDNHGISTLTSNQRDIDSVQPLIEANRKQLLIQRPNDTFHFVSANKALQRKIEWMCRPELECQLAEKLQFHAAGESRQTTIENVTRAIESIANSEQLKHLKVLLSPIPAELRTKLEQHNCENEWHSY